MTFDLDMPYKVINLTSNQKKKKKKKLRKKNPYCAFRKPTKKCSVRAYLIDREAKYKWPMVGNAWK